MLPSVFPGASLEVAVVRADRIKKGDIVCFPIDGHNMAVHRVIAIEHGKKEAVLVIRGDAQPIAETVPATAIAYRVERVKQRYFGYDAEGIVGRTFSLVAVSDGPIMGVIKKSLVRGSSLCLRAWKRYHGSSTH